MHTNSQSTQSQFTPVAPTSTIQRQPPDSSLSRKESRVPAKGDVAEDQSTVGDVITGRAKPSDDFFLGSVNDAETTCTRTNHPPRRFVKREPVGATGLERRFDVLDCSYDFPRRRGSV